MKQKNNSLILYLLTASLATAQTITPPTPLQTTTIFSITATTIVDCPTYATCIDNRSQQYRQNNYHAFRATGTGTWSVQMQFADGSPTGWTSFGASGLVTNVTPVSGIGYGIGYHDFISFVITGTATIQNYVGSKNYWTAGVTNTFNFPITPSQGGSNSTSFARYGAVGDGTTDNTAAFTQLSRAETSPLFCRPERTSRATLPSRQTCRSIA